MTYRELHIKAIRLFNSDKITLGEYEEMTKPLDREIENSDMEQKIIFDYDKCYVETPIYPNSVKRELVMTKDVFIQCFNKWIKGEQS